VSVRGAGGWGWSRADGYTRHAVPLTSASALFCWVVAGCGSRSELIGSLGTDDAGTVSDATGAQETSSMMDGGDAAGPDTGEAACVIPTLALGVGPQSQGSCAALTQGAPANVAPLCGSSRYVMQCLPQQGLQGLQPPTPDLSLNCDALPVSSADRSIYYCCPCEVTRLGCVNVDLSTYDRSCRSSSDCSTVTAGVLCPPVCLCPNAAINKSGATRYWQTLASLPPSSFPFCSCPNEEGAACNQGVCTYQ
jgi:hypothetical protein